MSLHFNSKGSDIEDKLELIPEKEKSKGFLCLSSDFVDEVKKNVKIAFPAMITNVFQYSLNVETTSFCGRLTSTEMEGVGLAISLINALGWCVCVGMVSACDTMISQSFGSEHKKRTGLFLQRGLLLMNLVPIALWGLHINFEPLLILCGQNPEISRYTGQFLVAFTPGLLFMMNYLLLARYMQDQGCLWPPVVAGVCGNIFNICSQLLFVIYLDLGVTASALCHAGSFGLMVLIEVVYILKTKFYLPTWPGFQLEALYDWIGMFKFGLAGIGHITFEVIIWEASVFMGGIMGNVELGTQSILLQLLAVTFMLYYGSGIACNIRVGQCLGANRPDLAKKAYRAAMLVTGITVLFLASMIMALRYQLPLIFTTDPEIINKVVETLPFMYLLIFVDPFSGIVSAALRGGGRQFTGCVVMFIAFYILCLPSQIILGFVFNFRVKGIWIGNTIGSIVSVFGCFFVLECQNWTHQAFLAQQRIICQTVKSDSQETEKLLPSSTMDIDGVREPFKHIRTPSHPIMCSIDVVKLPAPRSKMDKSIIYKRIAIFICVFMFFIFGLMVHLFLPVSLYRPAANHTINIRI